MLHRTDQDVSFWRDLALSAAGGRAAREPAGGVVLELACGTGRLTLPLARAGVPIVGLDNDPDMLAAAQRRAKAESLSNAPAFLAADMRRFALAQRFPLVFIGYNSLQLLTDRSEMTACLRHARRHLAPGGRVGLEVTDFQVGGADGPPDPRDSDAPIALAEAEGIRLSGTLVHDFATRTSRYRRIFEGPGWRREDELVMRSLDLAELSALLSHAGLTLARTWIAGTTVRALATD